MTAHLAYVEVEVSVNSSALPQAFQKPSKRLQAFRKAGGHH